MNKEINITHFVGFLSSLCCNIYWIYFGVLRHHQSRRTS